jgi:cytochrome c oxidase assembly protein subunit 15
VALACATFPLLWVGGLVTTTKAGMAVPDWPNTFGYNLFLYPWTTWLFGPWDVFVEHGHRLFASAVGLFTIGMLIALLRADDRVWIRRLGMAALALVIFQGVLGGVRVLLNEQTLAMIHGFTGPLFFALVTAIAVCTSQRWRNSSPVVEPLSSRAAGNVRRLAFVTAILVYLQIVLGAVLRHVPIDAEPATFSLAVNFHLAMAGILTLHVIMLVGSILRHVRKVKPLGGLAAFLAVLLLVQMALGAGTWVVKYSVPAWVESWFSIAPARGANVYGGWLQTHVVTAHVAVGSLLLATSTSIALYSACLLPVKRPGNVASARTVGAAL